MAIWTYWLIAACLIIVAEIFTGTFYLLVLAAALGGAGMYSLLFDAGIQSGFLIAAALSAVGMVYVYHWRKNRLSHNEDFDIGGMVQVEKPLSSGLWRVFYRGTTWEARAAKGCHFQMGDTARICGKDGSVLLIEDVS